MTIGAVQFDRGARLAVEFSIAVGVLLKVAIHAVHAFFQVNVGEVHHLLELLGIVKRNGLPVRIQQVSLAVVFVHRAEHPAVSVKIGELRLRQLSVEFRAASLLQKLPIGPQPARRRTLGVLQERPVTLVFARIVLLLWVHLLAVHFVVPPGVAEVARHHIRTRMNVAGHALTRRDRACEGVPDGMSRFMFWNRGIRCCALTVVAEFRIRP